MYVYYNIFANLNQKQNKSINISNYKTMKKVFLTLILLSFICTLFAQQVPRERVIVEQGTGLW